MTKAAETMESVVARATAYYARRAWHVAQEDLAQEAQVYALEALASARASASEDELRGYVYQAVQRRLAAFCWAASSPVSAARPSRKALAGKLRAPLEDWTAGAAGDLRLEIEAAEALGVLPELLDELRALVREEIAASSADPELAEAVRLALLEDANVQALARQRGICARKIYRAAERCRARIAESPRCRALWQQAQEYTAHD